MYCYHYILLCICVTLMRFFFVKVETCLQSYHILVFLQQVLEYKAKKMVSKENNKSFVTERDQCPWRRYDTKL